MGWFSKSDPEESNSDKEVSEEGIIQSKCPDCGREVEITQKQFDEDIECKDCGTAMVNINPEESEDEEDEEDEDSEYDTAICPYCLKELKRINVVSLENTDSRGYTVEVNSCPECNKILGSLEA